MNVRTPNFILSGLNRLAVRTVGCPECGARPGKKCATWRNGKRVYRISNHLSRIDTYKNGATAEDMLHELSRRAKRNSR